MGDQVQGAEEVLAALEQQVGNLEQQLLRPRVELTEEQLRATNPLFAFLQSLLPWVGVQPADDSTSDPDQPQGPRAEQ